MTGKTKIKFKASTKKYYKIRAWYKTAKGKEYLIKNILRSLIQNGCLKECGMEQVIEEREEIIRK